MKDIIVELKTAIDNNHGKIPIEFIQEQIKKATAVHVQMTPNTRVCILIMETGHEVVGYSQVLDAENDVEEIGNQIAYRNAADKLWAVYGSIAKVM